MFSVLLPTVLALVHYSSAPKTRGSHTPNMGIFDGVKDVFGAGDKPIVAQDRVTPFDKWLGLDKGLADETQKVNDVQYVDPADTQNYLTVDLKKPMGIAFVENEQTMGLYIDEVLSEGSANSSPLQQADQLVAVDDSLVLGAPFDDALDLIRSSEGETTKLVFFRGPAAFLYGPTQPETEWFTENILKM